MGFVSGDRTRRRSCLLRGQHKHGRNRSSTATGSTRHADRSINKGMSASRGAH